MLKLKRISSKEVELTDCLSSRWRRNETELVGPVRVARWKPELEPVHSATDDGTDKWVRWCVVPKRDVYELLTKLPSERHFAR